MIFLRLLKIHFTNLQVAILSGMYICTGLLSEVLTNSAVSSLLFFLLGLTVYLLVLRSLHRHTHTRFGSTCSKASIEAFKIDAFLALQAAALMYFPAAVVGDSLGSDLFVVLMNYYRLGILVTFFPVLFAIPIAKVTHL
jgi:hypothetical protein